MHTHKTSIEYDSPLELHAFAACAKRRMTAQKCSVPILDEISCRVCLGCEYAKFPAGNGLNSLMFVVLYMSPFEPLFHIRTRRNIFRAAEKYVSKLIKNNPSKRFLFILLLVWQHVVVVGYRSGTLLSKWVLCIVDNLQNHDYFPVDQYQALFVDPSCSLDPGADKHQRY